MLVPQRNAQDVLDGSTSCEAENCLDVIDGYGKDSFHDNANQSLTF
jgi:hypothetical protein